MKLEAFSDDLNEPLFGDYYQHDLWLKLGDAYNQLCDQECDDPEMMSEARRRQNIINRALAGRIPNEAIHFIPPVPPTDKLADVITEVNIAIFEKQWVNQPSFNSTMRIFSSVLNRMVEFTIQRDYVAELQRWVLLNCMKFKVIARV